MPGHDETVIALAFILFLFYIPIALLIEGRQPVTLV
jgi:hypothetical protein